MNNLPKNVIDWVTDAFEPEDILYELDLSSSELINALNRANIDLRIFEELYAEEADQFALPFEDDSV